MACPTPEEIHQRANEVRARIGLLEREPDPAYMHIDCAPLDRHLSDIPMNPTDAGMLSTIGVNTVRELIAMRGTLDSIPYLCGKRAESILKALDAYLCTLEF